jgi:predicted AAA+ superfamily ATPase
MNKNHSNHELKYKKRLIGDKIKKAIESFPVVVLTGARQVGKSTFLKEEFPDFKYLNLDEFTILEQAKIDPYSLWIGAEKVIIDEVQKCPEILLAIKNTVDKTQRKIKFILSGSSNLLLMKEISESLAGRAIYFEMFPMTYREITGNIEKINFLRLWKDDFIEEETLEKINPIPFILKGFMPPLLYINDLDSILLWWEGYIKTYLERDLRDLSQIENLVDFRKLMSVLAPRTGNIINQTEIARDIGLSQPTVYRYLKLLEILNIIRRVPAYFSSRIKRVIKSPKIFFIDPALCAYLSEYHDEETIKNARELGNFFETMVFLHLQVYSELLNPKGKLYYFRSISGKEVDFILEWRRKLLAFEVKLTENPTIKDIKNLIDFIEENPDSIRGVLIYTGDSVKYLHSKVIAIPWWWL